MARTWAIGDRIEYHNVILSQKDFDQEVLFGWEFFGPVLFEPGARPSFDDFASNTVHTNPDLARRQGLRGTIAPGTMFVAYITDMLLGELGPSWAEKGRLSVKFVGPAGSGDTLHTSATVREIVPCADGKQLMFDVSIVDQRGTQIVKGEARATVP